MEISNYVLHRTTLFFFLHVKIVVSAVILIGNINNVDVHIYLLLIEYLLTKLQMIC